MPKQKYQRPEVYATGKREKLWRAEWREYYIGQDGREHSRHKSKTWARADHTKAQAQADCDRMMRELQQGGPKADGAMTFKAFWDEIYYPVRSQRWTPNTRATIGYIWNLIEPLWTKPLKDITKASIDLHLLKLAEARKSASTVNAVRVRLHSILDEALDNDFILKTRRERSNPPGANQPRKHAPLRRMRCGDSGIKPRAGIM